MGRKFLILSSELHSCVHLIHWRWLFSRVSQKMRRKLASCNLLIVFSIYFLCLFSWKIQSRYRGKWVLFNCNTIVLPFLVVLAENLCKMGYRHYPSFGSRENIAKDSKIHVKKVVNSLFYHLSCIVVCT